jgi:hypothetical protein
MNKKEKLYLSLSIVVFVATLFSILTSDVPNGILDDTISFNWIIILLFTLLLPIFNFAEIIINRDDWSKYYWISLIFNILTIFFVMRFFKIALI